MFGGGTASWLDNGAIGLYIRLTMILAASQFYFWYFGSSTPLAPGEDRSA